MPTRFRPLLPDFQNQPLTPPLVRKLIEEALNPRHYFLDPGLKLNWASAISEEIRWELYQGRLLDIAHTRQTRRFESWNIFQLLEGQPGAEPLLSVKLDEERGVVHIVRGLRCHVWEAVPGDGNVVESREAIRWVRELVGSIHLVDFTTTIEFLDELIGFLWQAVVGTSRLPLTSLESPLPAFSLGQLGYCFTQDTNQRLMTHWSHVRARSQGNAVPLGERVKLLELVLRAATLVDIPEVAVQFQFSSPRETGQTLRALFNEVSLSPYNDFVTKALSFARELVRLNKIQIADQIDFLGHLLRQQGRHLTAYDLVTFHHRGANYPDALLLEETLTHFLALIEQCPNHFAGAQLRRRRALRQACWLRHAYEGHAVPNAPTSPGENQRVLPAPHQRVPEEQLLNIRSRSRRLFLEPPLTRLLKLETLRVLQASLDDLENEAEVIEMGTAIFIDRPFGVGKKPLEPDNTPLLAHECFSPSIAERRLHQWVVLATKLGLDFSSQRAQSIADRLRANLPRGIAIALVADPDRPVASLADARRVADDFVVLRTLPGGLRRLNELLDPQALSLLLDGGCLLRIQEKTGSSHLVGFDRQGQQCCQL